MTRDRQLPDLPGIVSSAQLRVTAEHIAGEQHRDGLIPWFAGHHADPWDHVEAAMALGVAGLLDEARAAFAWSAEHQAADGSWPMETVGAEVANSSVDANQCGYLAVGVWHHWLLTQDYRYVRELWPVVRSAVELVIDLQLPGGAISWSRGPDGIVNPDALLTGSACLVLSLRCGLALAEVVGDPQPEWELAVARLAHAVAAHPETFLDRTRYSMDWYYPVLGGAVHGARGRQLLASRWDEFVVAGRGARCVADRPWITAAETAELVLSLDVVGEREKALALLRDVQFLRADTGGYWTGWVFPDAAIWPVEQSTWSGAAVILAADALARHSLAHAVFHSTELPRLLELDCDRNCYAVAAPESS